MLRPEQRVQVDVSGLHRTNMEIIQGPRWVDGVVAEIDSTGRRVTVLLLNPVDGKRSVRVARVRVKAT
jgi:hypothetical protein